MNDIYWEGRKDLQYYRTVREFAEKYCPDGKTLLDVGGGVGLGCRYLEWFDGFDRTSVETPTEGCTLDGVRVIYSDFMDWEPDRKYDLVLCLQVLEHIPDPTLFARKLFNCGHVVILSVPYRWEAGTCNEHIHDPVDEEKLREWIGCASSESLASDSRLVEVFADAS